MLQRILESGTSPFQAACCLKGMWVAVTNGAGGVSSTLATWAWDPAGHVFVDGREDDRIVSGGENVFPQEVADTLLGHRDVADAAVFGVADEEFGQRLKAFVVPRADISEAYLKTRIARYKVPHLIFFLDNLPRNPGGKVLKQALAMG